MINLDVIKARAAAATPGPWLPPEYDEAERAYCVMNSLLGMRQHAVAWTVAMQNPRSRVDAAFIAAARQDVPALVAEVERLREELNSRDRLLRSAFEAGDNAMLVIARDESWNRWAR